MLTLRGYSLLSNPHTNQHNTDKHKKRPRTQLYWRKQRCASMALRCNIPQLVFEPSVYSVTLITAINVNRLHNSGGTSNTVTMVYMVWYGMFRGGFPHALRPLCGLLYVPCECSSSRHTLSPWWHRSPHLPENVGTITWRRNWILWWTGNVHNFAQRSPWNMRFFNCTGQTA
jgi:hypothetical protein